MLKYKKCCCSFSFFVGEMQSGEANELLCLKPEGTFLLREKDGDLRFSLLANITAGSTNPPKVVHIPIAKADDGIGWVMQKTEYSTISEMVEAQKQNTETAFQFKHEFKRN